MSELRLFDYLYDQLRNSPNDKAYGHQVDGAWRYYSTAQIVDMVNKTSVGLLQLGLRPGDKMATVVYKTSPEWVVLEFAMMQIGVLNVPMYPTISSREYQYILNESEIRYCVVGDGDLYDKVSAAAKNLPLLREIFAFQDHPVARRWDVLLAEGDLSEVERIKASIRPDDLATIVYTSGTTGNPKGVMLSHANITFNIECVKDLFPLQAGQRALSFLPVSHIFERVAVMYFTAKGISVTFTGLDNLGGETGDLRAIRPHVFAAVPRLLEKVYDKIYAKGLELRGLKRALFFWALKLSESWDFDKKFGPWKTFQWRIADKLIFSKWREALGGEVACLITGASACPVKIMRTFNAAGIPLREGYGMTEVAPALTFCRFIPGGAQLGTVGPALEGVELLIDDKGDYRPGEGEIIAKSPGVMLGYYKQPDMTAEVIRDINGERWFATGDVGLLVDSPNGEKFLKITDRKKELLKTSGGKYVAPTPIEAVFKDHHLVEQVMVVGENLKFVSALIVPSVDGLRDWCRKHEVHWTTLSEMIRHPRVVERYQMLVDRINPFFGHFEQVKKFTLLDSPWEPTKADGSDAELTPTLKLKRRVIMNKFKDQIDAMYQ